MYRDMDLIRDILIEIANADSSLDISRFYYLNSNKRIIHYHLQLLIEHDLIDAILHADGNKEVISGTVQGLTWSGRDYLESMKDSRVWNRAKDAISQTVGPTTLEVVKHTCSMIASQMKI